MDYDDLTNRVILVIYRIYRYICENLLDPVKSLSIFFIRFEIEHVRKPLIKNIS